MTEARLGIISGYLRFPVEACAAKAAALGLATVQVDFRFPDVEAARVDAATCRRIRRAFEARGIAIVGVSGHANLVAPDPARREANRTRLERAIALAHELGTDRVVTETGTRHPEDDWAAHPDTAKPGVYETFRDAIGAVARKAEAAGVTVLLEGGVGNVIDTPAKAARVLGEVESPSLGLVMDPANYLDADNLEGQREVLAALFAPALAARAGLVHAKDARRIDGGRRERHANLGTPDPRAEWPAAGLGEIDYGLFLGLWRERCPESPLLIEHLDENDVPRAKGFIEAMLARLPT
jgi:sugar phosphate isomerase/epimerase